MSDKTARKQAARAARERLAREQRRRRTLWTAITAVVVLTLAGLVGYGVYAAQKPSGYSTPRHAAQDATGVVDGSGPVTVDIYLDFMCPVCKSFEQEAGATLRKLADENRATVVYHPLAFLDPVSTTRYSTRSAASFGCAADQDRFVEYAEALFAQQPPEGGPGLSDDDLIRVAGSAGIADPAFASCVRGGTYTSWVRHTTDAASERGVTGTPTVLVAGQRIEQPTSSAITAAVEAAAK